MSEDDIIKAVKTALNNVFVNQNVLICICSYLALGVVEYFRIEHDTSMPVLYCCAKWLSITSTISVIATLIAYTIMYCVKRFCNNNK